MKSKLLPSALVFLICAACSQSGANHSNHSPATSSPSPSPTASATPNVTSPQVSAKNGDYDGKGVVTKIDMKLGSVEMDHEEIPGIMPPMRMEFYVSDKKMLDPLKLGDKVDFVLRYKDGSETIVNIKKSE